MRAHFASVDLSDAPLVHAKICCDFVVHISEAAGPLYDGDFGFCERLSIQVDNSVVETKPALTSNHRDETTPHAFGGRPQKGRSEAAGLLKNVAASSLKRGGLPGPPQLR